MVSVLESMGVINDDKDKAMEVHNGLPKRFETMITALDAIGDDDPSFTFDKVRDRLFQEEKRSAMRSTSFSIPGTSAFFTGSTEETGKRNKIYAQTRCLRGKCLQ